MANNEFSVYDVDKRLFSPVWFRVQLPSEYGDVVQAVFKEIAEQYHDRIIPAGELENQLEIKQK